jgi:hypothetical protein
MRTFTNILSLACLIAITYSCNPEELSTDNTYTTSQKKIYADDTGNDGEGEIEDRKGS